MAIVSHEHRYVFILNPRTACTALANGVLIPQLSGEWIPSEDQPGAPRKHTTVGQLRELGLLAGLEDYVVFGGVRNPFDSLVSLYTKIVTKYKPAIERNPNHFYLTNPGARREAEVAATEGFSAWLKLKYARTLKRGPRHFHGKWMEGVDVYLRFEKLQDDWRNFAEHWGLPHADIPRINETEGRSEYQEYYDADARALVEEVFAPTLEKFAYRF